MALTSGQIADLLDGELIGQADVRLARVASLEEAGPGDLSFLASTRYVSYFHATSAGAVLVSPEFRAVTAGPATRIVVDDPRAALDRVSSELSAPQAPRWEVHPTAIISQGASWSGRITRRCSTMATS